MIRITNLIIAEHQTDDGLKIRMTRVTPFSPSATLERRVSEPELRQAKFDLRVQVLTKMFGELLDPQFEGEPK